MSEVAEFLVKGIILIFYVILYPVGGGLSATAASLAFSLLTAFPPAPVITWRWLLAGAVAFAVGIFTMQHSVRAEGYFARSRAYRGLRYALRLLTILLIALLGVIGLVGLRYSEPLIFATERVAGDPVLGLLPLLVTAVMAWVLRIRRLRVAWHEFTERHGIRLT